MPLHPLENWNQYLTPDDYNYLIQYIENIKNDILNDKMMILHGPARSGKTTLINDIQRYLGEENYHNFPMSGDIIYIENIKKLVIIPDIDIRNKNYKKHNIAILNLIKYKQSILTVSYEIEKVNKMLLEYSKVIYMNHIFKEERMSERKETERKETERKETEKKETEKPKYKSISLFSGLGGDSIGMKEGGCEIMAYNEINELYCKSHEENMPECELICEGKIKDISKIPDSRFEKYKGKTDILFAGFPCQGFSTAGKKKDDDPRNTLFLQFLRVAKIINPWMIIGENVKGLLTRKTNTGELYIDVIVSEFEKIGYEVIYKVFKTEEYNVPQKRERLIILGIKKDNPYGCRPSFPSRCPIPLNLIPIIKYNMTGAVKVNPKWFEQIPPECILTNMNDTTIYPDNNGGHPYLLRKINAEEKERNYNEKEYDNLFSFGKRISPIHCEIIDIRTPSKTIICTYEHQPRLFVPLKNPSGFYLRMLLPDELKQIQGFPPDYIICGSNKDKIIQIGNAVPPPLIKAIVLQATNPPP